MSDFDWNDVTEFYSWMKRPAVIVSPNLGVLEGWYAVSPDNNWSRVYPIELQQHGEAMTKKDFYNTFSDYIKIPSPTKSSTTRKDFRIDWESLDKSMENITPERWQKAREDLDKEHNRPRKPKNQ